MSAAFIDFVVLAIVISLLLTTRPASLQFTCLFYAITVIVAHIVYSQILFQPTGGLDPVYNDEIFFLKYDATTCSISSTFSSLFNLNASQAAPFACIVQTIKPFAIDAPFTMRLVNCAAVLVAVNGLTRIPIDDIRSIRAINMACYLIVLSPTIMFFSTKVLRDITLMTLVTGTFFMFFLRKWAWMLTTLLLIFILRRHLAIAIGFGFLVSLLRLSPLAGAGLAFLISALFSIFKFGPFSEFLALFPDYILQWLFSMNGLHFLVADNNMFNTSPERVFLQRLMVPDSFAPLILVNIFALLPHTWSSLYGRIMSFFFPTMVWYLFFYFHAGFTSARQTVLPFLPLILIATCSLATYNGWLKKSVQQ